MIADSACINSERSLGAKEGTRDWSRGSGRFRVLDGVVPRSAHSRRKPPSTHNEINRITTVDPGWGIRVFGLRGAGLRLHHDHVFHAGPRRFGECLPQSCGQLLLSTRRPCAVMLAHHGLAVAQQVREAMVRKHYGAWTASRQEKLTATLREAFAETPRPGVENVVVMQPKTGTK